MATRNDIASICKLLVGGIPNAKITEDTIKTWLAMFGGVHRLKLMRCAKTYMLNGGRFFPTVGEMMGELMSFGSRFTYWKPPGDPGDEHVLWLMECGKLADVGDLTEAQVREIYPMTEPVEVSDGNKRYDE